MLLGIYWDKLDVFRYVLDNILEKKNNVPLAKLLLSDGALLMLDNEQSKQNLSWPEFSFVVSNLVDDDTAHIFVTMFLLLKKQRKKIKYK